MNLAFNLCLFFALCTVAFIVGGAACSRRITTAGKWAISGAVATFAAASFVWGIAGVIWMGVTWAF